MPTLKLPNAHNMKIYVMIVLIILIRAYNVDTFFYIVGQCLRSLTLATNYVHPILGRREYIRQWKHSTMQLQIV
jgi:hypothetical protein